MRKTIAGLVFVFTLFGCDKKDSTNKNENEYLSKTIENFNNLSDNFYAKIYLDHEDDKEDEAKKTLYEYAYTLRLKTENLVVLLENGNNCEGLKDSLLSYKQYIILKLDSKNDRLFNDFINSQFTYDQIDFKKLPKDRVLLYDEILADIKIIEYEILNYLYTR